MLVRYEGGDTCLCPPEEENKPEGEKKPDGENKPEGKNKPEENHTVCRVRNTYSAISVTINIANINSNTMK